MREEDNKRVMERVEGRIHECTSIGLKKNTEKLVSQDKFQLFRSGYPGSGYLGKLHS